MGYGPNLADIHRCAVYYVDRCVKGARSADLLIEQSHVFEFALNPRTAKTLGLTVPHHLLLQATEVVQ